MAKYRNMRVVIHKVTPKKAKTGSGVKFHGKPKALPRNKPAAPKLP